MTRPPIRLRLTIGFVAGMALLLAAGGLMLHRLMERSLDNEINRALAARTADLAALVVTSGAEVTTERTSLLTQRGESMAQVLTTGGAVLDATPGLRMRSLLRPEELRTAAGRGLTIDHVSLRERGGQPVRLRAATVDVGGQRLVIVVGSLLEARDRTLRKLALLLYIGIPFALLAVSGLGYAMATAALRPVEAMRARAERISGRKRGARLPLPAARDEVHRLGETLNAMLARIDASIEREQAFLSDASHELRTPLTILKTELELAGRPGRSSDELRAAIDSALEETDRLIRLAEDLLVIARLDQGRLPVRPERIDLARLLDEVAARFRPAVTSAGRVLSLDQASRAPLMIEADPTRLQQAIGNLVANALSHGEGGIVVKTVADLDRVSIHVCDEGPGLAADFLPVAFDRFSRADHARTGGGSGLGLSIVAAIAAAHEGSAGASGADVWIEIPHGDARGSSSLGTDT